MTAWRPDTQPRPAGPPPATGSAGPWAPTVGPGSGTGPGGSGPWQPTAVGAGPPTWQQGPPPPGWGPGAAPPTDYRRRGSTARTVAAVVIGVLLVVGVLGAVAVIAFKPVTDTLAPGFDAARDVISDSGGRVAGARYRVTNGVAFLEVTLAEGRSADDARDVACTVVPPALARHGLAGTSFGVFSTSGRRLADEDTCPQGAAGGNRA